MQNGRETEWLTDSFKYRFLFYTKQKPSFSSKSFSESMIKQHFYLGKFLSKNIEKKKADRIYTGIILISMIPTISIQPLPMWLQNLEKWTYNRIIDKSNRFIFKINIKWHFWAIENKASHAKFDFRIFFNVRYYGWY